MKKYAVLLLTILSVCIVLCACNVQKDANTDTAATQTITSSEAPTTEAVSENFATFDEAPTDSDTVTESIPINSDNSIVDEIPDENRVEVEWLDDYDPFDE